MKAWHPQLAAQEYQPGRWVMLDTFKRPYAMIAFVKRGNELGYRADRWTQVSTKQELVGYFRTLAGACAAAHQVYLRNLNASSPDPLGGHTEKRPPSG